MTQKAIQMKGPALAYYHSFKGWHIGKTGLIHGCPKKKSQSPYDRVRWSTKENRLFCVACHDYMPEEVQTHMMNVIKMTGLPVGCWIPG